MALVSTTCLEELQMVKMWMGRCKTDVLLALFPILLSQWKILCWPFWRDAQELIPRSGTILKCCVVENQLQTQTSKPSITLKLVELDRKALQKAGLSLGSQRGRQKVKLNSPKVLLHFCRSDLNTGQTKEKKGFWIYIKFGINNLC